MAKGMPYSTEFWNCGSRNTNLRSTCPRSVRRNWLLHSYV